MENGPCQFSAREIERAHPGKGKGFIAAARHRRGVTAWVEREGAIALGETARLHVPPLRSYPPLDSRLIPEVSMSQPSDIAIARAAAKRPIQEIGADLGIPADQLIPFGHDKAKVAAEFIAGLGDKPDGKLILVTAINPTPAGEGKTTTTVGLGDGLNAIGKRTMICLREPSLGPCFGMKGGAAGGGYAQIVPMEDINLHFTGDFHAITSANNLLSAMIDNHIYWGNALDIDPRRVTWRRVMDMNDRALREIVCSLGGVRNGYPREGGFDITVASEVMAILCLAADLEDLERRLGAIIIGYTRDRRPVHARDLKADGAMAVLLSQAMQPNLVQTLENNPAFVHGGPFANIAHGCNSVVATRTALKLADFVVTEAGFGADLGAEKFFDIKCRKAGLHPDAAVIVATVRALKFNGGVARAALGEENVAAVEKGCANLGRHLANVRSFGVPALVAINHFDGDTEAEIAAVQAFVASHGSEAVVCRHWAERLARHRRSRHPGRPPRRIRNLAVRRALSRRHAAPEEDRDRRQAHLWRRRGAGRHPDPGAAARLGAGGLRRAAGLHGQDPILVLDRSRAARRPLRLRCADPRGAAGRRRGFRGGHLRRDHDHAGAAARSLRRGDPARRRRQGRGPVLIPALGGVRRLRSALANAIGARTGRGAPA